METKKRRIGISFGIVMGILILLVITLILSLSLITAAGVGRPYWNDNPLKLAPGESKIVQLTLQNTGPENMTFKATITSDIAILDDKNDEYFVPSGEIDKQVNIKVEVPEDAEIGTIYRIISSFTQISSGEGGMIMMAGAFTINFPVEVVGEEESEQYGQQQPQGIPTSTIIIVVLAIVIIAIIIYTSKKQKVKKKIIK
jgi:hypothetical protein